MVNTNFTVNGISFQTYYFSDEFSDLTNVVFSAGALDNLRVQLPTIQPVLSIAIDRAYSQSYVVLRAQGTLGLRYRMDYTDVFPATNWTMLTTFDWTFYDILGISSNLPPHRFFRAVELP